MGPGPADLNVASTNKDCDLSGAPLVGTDNGARARAGGTCLVAVLHAASVIGCWRRAAGAASLRTAPDAPPPTPDDASRIQNIIHKTPTQLPTYDNASCTRRTRPTPDDASRMADVTVMGTLLHSTCKESFLGAPQAKIFGRFLIAQRPDMALKLKQ